MSCGGRGLRLPKLSPPPQVISSAPKAFKIAWVKIYFKAAAVASPPAETVLYFLQTHKQILHTDEPKIKCFLLTNILIEHSQVLVNSRVELIIGKGLVANEECV